MDCPRCETNIPDEALYCPYCSLPKPKPAVEEVSAQPEAAHPAPAANPEQPQPAVAGASTGPSGSIYATAAHRRLTPRPQRTTSAPRPKKKREKREFSTSRKRLLILVAAGLLAFTAAGFHSVVLPMLKTMGPDAKVALDMVDTLRKTPSNDGSLTVDARLQKELDTYRRVGTLRRYQAWRIKSLPGSKSQFLIIFSFEESDGTQHSAEWLADSSARNFTPQTELAKSIYAGQTARAD
jgi:hypothetical protein